MSKKVFLVSIFSALILGIASVYLYRSFVDNQSGAYSIGNSVVEVLKTESEDYRTANAYQKEGDFAQARVYYEKALSGAADSAQESSIKFSVALMTEFDGQYVDAIRLFKEVAANTRYHAITRAYAVQEMGRMHYLYYDADASKVITAEIFKDTPYNVFARKDERLSYRKLFEYSVSIYPLALSESFIADWYAQDLATTLKGATTTTEGKAHIATIANALKQADKQIERMKSDSTQTSFLGEIYSREAFSVGRLAAMNIPEYTHKRAEDLHKKAMHYAAVGDVPPGNFFALQYATFLTLNFGTKRSEDIKRLLSDFSTTNPENIDKNVTAFFRTARTSDSLSQTKKALVRMAHISSPFKTYLISLGWTEADFARKI